MTDLDDPGRFEREPLSEQDLAIAALVGRYVERRERGEAPCAHDLLAVAGEFGDSAVAKLRTVLAVYEALRASEDSAARRADPPPEGGTPWRACGWAGIGPPAGWATRSRRT
jgi:hypothetical protein